MSNYDVYNKYKDNNKNVLGLEYFDKVIYLFNRMKEKRIVE